MNTNAFGMIRRIVIVDNNGNPCFVGAKQLTSNTFEIVEGQPGFPVGGTISAFVPEFNNTERDPIWVWDGFLPHQQV